MKRKFASLALGSVNQLKVLVTAPTMQAGSLGSRAADALETRLGRLYRGCGASTVAAMSVFPNLNSLNIDERTCSCSNLGSDVSVPEWPRSKHIYISRIRPWIASGHKLKGM